MGKIDTGVVVAKFKSGMKPIEIADLLGVNVTSIYHHLDKAGVERYRRGQKRATDTELAVCSVCKEKPRVYPGRHPRNSGKHSHCEDCSYKYKRNLTLRKWYKMSLSDYEEMLEAQNGVCLICELPPKPGVVLRVDHDHACCPGGSYTCGKCVRGLLCATCNSWIGRDTDYITVLKRAIAYIEGDLRAQ